MKRILSLLLSMLMLLCIFASCTCNFLGGEEAEGKTEAPSEIEETDGNKDTE